MKIKDKTKKDEPKDKLKKLELQINSLQTKKIKLESRRKDEIFKIINRCNATKIPDEILAGVISEAVAAYGAKDHRVNKWQEDGLKLMKPGRGRRKIVRDEPVQSL